jgi:hypothetical protein
LSLGRGSMIHVTIDNDRFLFSLSREWDNSDILASFLEHFGVHPFYPLLHDDALPFIASEFHTLNDTELSQIPLSTLYHILSHPLLTIRSEDSLYSYIRSHVSSDPASFHLLQFVHFEYLSLDSISDLVDLNPAYIDRRLWSAISPWLTSSASFLRNESKLHAGRKFPLGSANSLDGIVSYLTQKYRGNVHDKGIVTITSKSLCVVLLGSLPTHFLGRSTGQGSGFVGISIRYASARLTTQSEVGPWDRGWLRVRWTVWTGEK